LFTDFLTRSKAVVSTVKVNLALFADCRKGPSRSKSCRVLIDRTKFSTDTATRGLADAGGAVAPLAGLVADDFLLFFSWRFRAFGSG
jgi:hypothetical protein